MVEQLPRLLGPYELLECLSGGRVATTYLARERRAEGTPASAPDASRLVSLKLLHPFADVAEQRTALAREADLQSRCSHAGVVRILEAPSDPPLGVDRGRCIVRPYVSGFSLSELLHAEVDRNGCFGVVGALGDCLLEILAAVHATGSDDGRTLGLFHRDVTPSNVLLSLDGEVCLTDFGLAHAPGAFGLLSDEEVAQGTPRYVTPEAARGEQPDGRSDLFQTALLLLEALGCPVRDSVSSLEMIRREQLRAELPQLVGDRAGAFGWVLAEALDADPTRRFATAADMRTAWRAARLASEAKATASSEPDTRTETIRTWLHGSFPELVRNEQDRVGRALAREAR
jgi:serine/threonine-protein kinase